jgi:hypothetical protein
MSQPKALVLGEGLKITRKSSNRREIRTVQDKTRQNTSVVALRVESVMG